MFPCRLFVQGTTRSFAEYGHPELLSQCQIRYDPSVPRFCPFVSLHKQTEKLALNIVCYEFYKLHSRQPLVKQDDTWQPLIACSKSGRAGLLIWPYFLHPNPAHNVVVGQIPNLYLATCHMFIQSVILRCIYVIWFEHLELPAKQLDYFLRSNKSNTNQ